MIKTNYTAALGFAACHRRDARRYSSTAEGEVNRPRVYTTLKTSRYDDAEDFVHDFISHFNQSLRIRPNREYFKVDPEEALDILYKVKKLMNEPGAEIVVYDEQGKKHMKQLEKKHGCREEAPEVAAAEKEVKPLSDNNGQPRLRMA